MRRSLFLLSIVLILPSLIMAGDNLRDGLVMGIDFQTTNYINPYVSYEGQPYEPRNLITYNDKSSFVYFPFGWASYSDQGFGEFSTYAGHLLITGLLNLISPNKEYKYTTDKVYTGDSWADGYVPVFDEFGNQTSDKWPLTPGEGLEGSYAEMDFLRLVFSGRVFRSFPLTLGGQGGIGSFGVNFAKVREGSEPSLINNDGPGVVNFNKLVDLYYGLNVGWAQELFGGQLVILNAQYDWHFFLKDDNNDEYRREGNRIRVELNWFPFSTDSALENIIFNAYYIQNKVPYFKKFNKYIPVTFENKTIAFSIRYLL